MTFDEARPIVEGILYSYALMVLDYPGPAVSSPDRVIGTGDGTSQQEAWAVRYQRELLHSAAIERVLRSLPEIERMLIKLRYFDRKSWRTVARQIHVSERVAFSIRDRALAVFAYELGLTKPEPARAAR